MHSTKAIKEPPRAVATTPHPGKIATLERPSLHVLARGVVHSRAPDLQERLRGAHVVLVGVGSLGSALAVLLGRAGVGRLTLIDPETLEAANLGRHALGTPHLGISKAVALRTELRRDIPTVEVSAIPGFVQVATSQVLQAFETASLVLVSSANWWSELWLWERKASGATWPLVQVWSEPHGLVGHVLTAPAQFQDDARRLFDNTGRFLHRLSEWPNEGIVHQPACGASYIPGGPIALNAIATMGTQAAIDALISEITALV